MARRSENWNTDLAKWLRKRAFARAFLLAAINEDLTVQQALAKVIRAIGITEFAAQVGMPRPNVQRAIHPACRPHGWPPEGWAAGSRPWAPHRSRQDRRAPLPLIQPRDAPGTRRPSTWPHRAAPPRPAQRVGAAPPDRQMSKSPWWAQGRIATGQRPHKANPGIQKPTRIPRRGRA